MEVYYGEKKKLYKFKIYGSADTCHYNTAPELILSWI